MPAIANNGAVIFSKYHVGDVRYFPRVYDRYDETETIEGEYTIIKRRIFFEPSVKAKEIRAVEIVIGYDKQVTISYRMLTVGEKEDIIFRIARAYGEDLLDTKSYATYDEAMSAAKQAASEERYSND